VIHDLRYRDMVQPSIDGNGFCKVPGSRKLFRVACKGLSVQGSNVMEATSLSTPAPRGATKSIVGFISRYDISRHQSPIRIRQHNFR